jgi:hypothetical protein
MAPDHSLAAVCGLFCPACHVYQATQAGPAEVEKLAQRFGRSVDELTCRGCRSTKRCFFCEQNCTFVTCAARKGVDFCGACAEYPCAELEAFRLAAPHRLDLPRSHAAIREHGWEAWYRDMAERFACPDCGTLSSAYHPTCRVCGRTPSCAFVAEHGERIREHMARR